MPPRPHLLPSRSTRGPSAAVLAALVACLLVLAGCGGSATKDAGPSPAAVMAKAKKQFDAARSVQVALSTTSVPTSGNGVLAATGTVTRAPAFQGDVKVVLSGLTATVPITSVGGKVYARLPLQTKFSVIDPKEYGAPDPAQFADSKVGLSSLLTKIQGLARGKQVRSAGSVLTTYTGQLPGSAVKQIIPSADAGQKYATVVGVDSSGHAQTVKITGPFFSGGGDVTYNATFSGYDKPVTVTAPAAG
ncbi:hypothetical protein GCM10027596_33640 [Nocardioides korecus]